MTGAILATFSDVIGFLAQSFKLAAVFPAFVFVFLNEILILPHLPQKGLVAQVATHDLSGKLVIAAVCSLLLGYILSIVNIPLIRLFEGYPWRATWLGDLCVACQEARRRRREGLNPALEEKKSRLRKKAALYEPDHLRRRRLYQKRAALEGWLETEGRIRDQEVRDYFPAATATLPPAPVRR